MLSTFDQYFTENWKNYWCQKNKNKNFWWQQQKWFLVCERDMSHLSKVVTSSIKIFYQNVWCKCQFYTMYGASTGMYNPQAALEIIRTKLHEGWRCCSYKNKEVVLPITSLDNKCSFFELFVNCFILLRIIAIFFRFK